ncbi:MAG TPA: EAL domain-containing protein [Magnetospirillum sp.]|nr:EAL domain-containing protein [Magnetospirillum sp.]
MARDLRVLLVEDSPDDADLIEMELVRGDYAPQIRRVETASEMLAALADDWDVVLSDFNLPSFSAERALGVLQTTGRDLPFIILSGVVEAEDAVILLKRGAHDFIDKNALARLVPAIGREVREADERASRRRAEDRVRILSQAVEQSPVSVVITDHDGLIQYVNPKFEDATGYESIDAVGRDLDFTARADTPAETFREMWGQVRQGAEWRGEFCNRRRDGSLMWEHVTVSPLTDGDGAITNFIAVKEDVTLRRTYEERLLRQANFDDLTGLPNRVLMLDRLDQAIAAANRTGNLTALLYIDVDRFKDINDSLGHDSGDQILRHVADRLAACVREGDSLARMGGDEFVIILPAIDDDEAARYVAERVTEVMARPMLVQGCEYFITASIGITLYPNDGADRQVLLKNADLAMYKAKEMGRNRYRFFTSEFNRRLQERLALEGQLRGAAERRELLLHYQPIFDLGSRTAVGVEALLRWQLPCGEMRMPGDFIPIAEDTGLIGNLGQWVVETACGELAGLLRGRATPGRVAVNVSPRQLQDQEFGPMVARLLGENGLRPEHLELEITESVLMDDTRETAANLDMLCDMGIRLSIDDFGTGYSSLGYLQRYPFSTLKIDRSFVTLAPHNRGAGRLVETIIAMAHGLGLEVIAEGVETEEQADFLRQRRCDQVQGYLFGRPQPLAQTAGVLAV